MCTKTLNAVVLLLVLLCSSCSALDRPKSQAAVTMAELSDNVAALEETLDFYNVDVPDNGCPVCGSSSSDSGDSSGRSDATDIKSVDGVAVDILVNIMAKARGLIRNSSTFARLQRMLKTKRGRRQYNAVVSVKDSLLPILHEASLHFSNFDKMARQVRVKAKRDSLVPVQVVDFLNEVAATSATVISDITRLLEPNVSSKNATASVTAGTVATSVIAVLSFYKRVTLPATTIAVDYLSALATGRTAVNGDIREKVDRLRESLSPTKSTGVFYNVLDFLKVKNDVSGLSNVLTRLSKNMTRIADRLDDLVTEADALIVLKASSRDGSDNNALAATKQSKALVGTVNVLSGMIATTVTSVNRLALDIVPVVGGALLGSVLGLMVGLFNGILNQFVVTLRSTLQMVGTSGNTDTTVSGDILLYLLCALNLGEPQDDGPNFEILGCFVLGLIPLAVVLSPIWVPLLFVYYVYNIIKNVLNPPPRPPVWPIPPPYPLSLPSPPPPFYFVPFAPAPYMLAPPTFLVPVGPPPFAPPFSPGGGPPLPTGMRPMTFPPGAPPPGGPPPPITFPPSVPKAAPPVLGPVVPAPIPIARRQLGPPVPTARPPSVPVNRGPTGSFAFSCQLEALACHTKALSDALPTV